MKIQYSGRNEHKINEYKLFAARKKDDFKKQFGDLVDVTMVHDKANEDALEFYISGTARAVYSTKRGDPPQVEEKFLTPKCEKYVQNSWFSTKFRPKSTNNFELGALGGFSEYGAASQATVARR